MPIITYPDSPYQLNQPFPPEATVKLLEFWREFSSRTLPHPILHATRSSNRELRSCDVCGNPNSAVTIASDAKRVVRFRISGVKVRRTVI